MKEAILAHPLDERILAQEGERLGRETNAHAVKKEIAPALALEHVLEVGLGLAATRATRVNGRRVRIVRVDYDGLVGRIDAGGRGCCCARIRRR